MEASHNLTESSAPPQVTASKTLPAENKGGFRSRPIAFLIFAIVLTAVFGRALYSLFGNALGNDPNSDLNSYIVLIPFVSLYLLYIDRTRLPRSYQSDFGWAALLFVPGAAALIFLLAGFHQAAALSGNDRLSIITFAFVALLWAGGFTFLGRKWMAAAAFPMFFLIFLVPLPDRVVYWMELGLKMLSADAASLFFALTGTPVLRTGQIFQLPGITIEVAQECSGIRSSWILLITSLVAAHLFLTRRWSKLVLISAVIPLGILRNGFRIMVIGLLCVHVDPSMIHSVIHRRGGPIFFALSLIPLLLLMWFLRKREVVAGNLTASTSAEGE